MAQVYIANNGEKNQVDYYLDPENSGLVANDGNGIPHLEASDTVGIVVNTITSSVNSVLENAEVGTKIKLAVGGKYGLLGAWIGYEMNLEKAEDQFGNEGYKANFVSGGQTLFESGVGTLAGVATGALIAGIGLTGGTAILAGLAVGFAGSVLTTAILNDNPVFDKDDLGNLIASGYDIFDTTAGELVSVFNTVDSGNDYSGNTISPENSDSVALVETTGNMLYEIQPGDTVWNLAQRYGLTVEEFLLLPGNEYLRDRLVQESGGGEFLLIREGEIVSLPVSAPAGMADTDTGILDAIGAFLEAQVDRTLRSDPLVLDLDGDGIELIDVNDSNAFFDLDEDGFAERVGWIGGDDGMLAVDQNSNGQIDGMEEVFGNATTSGFVQLAPYDTNGDGLVDASDANFADLRIWKDVNEDGVTDAGELTSLAANNNMFQYGLAA